MALHINNPSIEKEIRALAEQTGETLTDAIGTAVREKRIRLRPKRKPDPKLLAELMEIAKRMASRPIMDHRTHEEILGYDDVGLPT